MDPCGSRGVQVRAVDAVQGEGQSKSLQVRMRLVVPVWACLAGPCWGGGDACRTLWHTRRKLCHSGFPLLSLAFCERPSAQQAQFDLSLAVSSMYVACREADFDSAWPASGRSSDDGCGLCLFETDDKIKPFLLSNIPCGRFAAAEQAVLRHIGRIWHLAGTQAEHRNGSMHNWGSRCVAPICYSMVHRTSTCAGMHLHYSTPVGLPTQGKE